MLMLAGNELKNVMLTRSSHLKQTIDGRDGCSLECRIVERRPSICRGRTVDPAFVVAFLSVLKDGEDLVPLAWLRCVEEVGALLVIGAVR